MILRRKADRWTTVGTIIMDLVVIPTLLMFAIVAASSAPLYIIILLIVTVCIVLYDLHSRLGHLQDVRIELGDGCISQVNESKGRRVTIALDDDGVLLDLDLWADKEGRRLARGVELRKEGVGTIEAHLRDWWTGEDIVVIWEWLRPHIDRFEHGKMLRDQIEAGWDLSLHPS